MVSLFEIFLLGFDPGRFAVDHLANICLRSNVGRTHNQARVIGYLQTNGFTMAADDLIDEYFRQFRRINYARLKGI